jgi:hypothetical protein
MNLTVSDQAAELLRERGGVAAIDFVAPVS